MVAVRCGVRDGGGDKRGDGGGVCVCVCARVGEGGGWRAGGRGVLEYI